MRSREIERKIGRPEPHSPPNRIRNSERKHVRGERSAQQLRHPIRNRVERADPFRYPESNRYRRIQMPARNVSHRRDHHSRREAVGDSYTENADPVLPLRPQIRVRANRARPDENQRKCADKFRKQLLRQTVQANLRDERRNQYVPERIRDDAEPARFYSIKPVESKRGGNQSWLKMCR